MDNTSKPEEKTWVEEIQVQGGELVGKIQELLRDATATRVTICKPNGEELISLPLTVGVLVGGLLTLAAPRLAAIGAIGGLIAQFKLKVERHSDGQVEVRTLEEESRTDFPDQPA
ncbi:MAG: hypothetical protein KatS3mg074_032 [Meiothermus sp.]|uniref:DUF4342 domain-containing protein n=2 Tax=Meiothermus hypogaeus TaxID=884155 RepID=A0A511R7R4_9DEIN|nr:DUF4342 domain-containing protein [Meiothermus hypogaeus]RIH75668.1 hypothetical protein Mhypo_02822 [Meiothermus hypogaeus]GEM84962.1 hypothetical protein MHY01S_31280 [Meiothermus hypogaeus NBRC 106114]GIW37634.1 MAG: hypothetical protein KatS3mg074_032 [Meiothermus sp.]